MKNTTQSLIYIHTAVLLFGVAGVFGKLLLLPALFITFGRVFFASIGLGLFLFISKKGFKIESIKPVFVLLLAGIILAFHWWSFFYSIQLSTIAIGLLTFSTFPVFTVFLEPFVFKERLYLSNIFVALFTFSGIYLIIPSFSFENAYFLGALWGITSGFSFSILQLINRQLIKSINNLKITFYEVLMATIVLTPLIIQDIDLVSINNLFLLIVLGLIFTALAHSLFIKGLRNMNVFSSSIITSLEPVYGIILGIFIISEVPGLTTILGGMIILLSNFLIIFVKKKKS